MSAETTGIPLVVRYNSQGQADGLKEELNILVNSVSANEYKGGNFSVTSLNSVSSINDISLSSPITPGDVLTWNNNQKKWVNEPPPGGGPGVTKFADLADVNSYISNPPVTNDKLIRLDLTAVTTKVTFSNYGESDLVNLATLYTNVQTKSPGDVLRRGSDPTLVASSPFKFSYLDDVVVTPPDSENRLLVINDDSTVSDTEYSTIDLTNFDQIYTDYTDGGASANALVQVISDVASIVLDDAAKTVKVEVRNETAESIAAGKVVYVTGVHGTSAKKLTINVLSTATTNLEDKLIGVLETTLAVNGEGLMTIIGPSTIFNTAITNIGTGTEGQPLFLDPNNPGNLTTTPPAKPTPALEVGVLLRRDSVNGRIFVRILRTGKLNTLYDIDIPSPTNDYTIIRTTGKYTQTPYTLAALKDTAFVTLGPGNILEYNGSKWVNVQPTVGGIGFDFTTSPPTDGDLISYNSSTSSFETITLYHSDLPDLNGNHHPQYVLSATNQNLSSLVGGIETLVEDIETSTISLSSYIAANESSWLSAPLEHNNLGSLTESDDHPQYIINSPLTNSRNIIEPASTSIGLTLQQPSIHTQPLLAVKNSVGIYSLTVDGDGNIETTGRLTAESKSFLIDHPTKEGKKLQYTCLEGPENGVYCRGRVKTGVIELPDYWVGLVDEDTITVNLTPVGKAQPSLFVSEIKQNKIYLSYTDSIDCFYTVYAERKDIEKLIVEF
jgi:hypothetical protein